MLVNLHGFPGSDGKMTAYDIPQFQQSIIVQAAVSPGIEYGRAIGCGDGIWTVWTVQAALTFCYRYESTAGYHYELTEIDGIEVAGI